MWLIQLGEVIFGGVGSGLYGMLVFAIIAVFIAGLMVGRTPEYLGKKLEAFEMKMASLVILIPPFFVAGGHRHRGVAARPGAPASPIPVRMASPRSCTPSPPPSNNNGSAFAGLSANTPFYNTLLGHRHVGVALLADRAGAGDRGQPGGQEARARRAPARCPTHTPLFVVLLAATVLIVGALAFFPALALGPIVEELQFLDIASH